MSDDHVPRPLPHRPRQGRDLGRLVQFAAGGLFCAFVVWLGWASQGVWGVVSVGLIGLCVAGFSWWLHRLAARR